jgi:hypothetical protein
MTTLSLPYNDYLPPTSNRHIDIKDFSYLNILQKDPLSEFFLKKEPGIGSGATGYISLGEIFQFFISEFSRPFNFLFQIARGSGATLRECPFSPKKHTSLEDFFQEGPL